jgi:hypothetical protein
VKNSHRQLTRFDWKASGLCVPKDTQPYRAARFRNTRRLLLVITTTPSSINSLPAVSRKNLWACGRKITENFLLFSKRNRVIIPVGNLKEWIFDGRKA